MIVAFSGGIDSAVLTHFLNLRKELTGIAHYVYDDPNSNFPKEALKVAEQTATKYKVPLYTNNTNNQYSNNKEDNWRKQRYEFFKEIYLKTNSSFAFGHHLDDQLASYVLSFVKGSERCFIPPNTAVNDVPVIRPFTLQNVWKEDIRHYAETHNISYVEDPFNQYGDRYLAERASLNLREIHQFIPVFKKNYLKYLDKHNLHFKNKRELDL